jgi:hypothetical protein
MTKKSPVPHKLSLASAYRRVAAKFRRGDHRSSEDYLRYERNTYDSDLPRLMREESAGEQMRNLGSNPWGGA